MPNVIVVLRLSDTKTRVPATGLSNSHVAFEPIGFGAFTIK